MVCSKLPYPFLRKSKLSIFNRQAAIRITSVSLILAFLVAPLAWFMATENAEDNVVALAMEESNRLLLHFNATNLNAPDARDHATEAVKTITGGLFDIAELYDGKGGKLAESSTDEGKKVESLIPKHGKPTYLKTSYESLHLPDGRWVLRVFVPLLGASGNRDVVTGYFEGVRIVPDWEQAKIRGAAFQVALLASLAAILCGAAIYPIVVHLSADNQRKARAVLDSHISMMEALGRAIAKRDSDTGTHNYRVAWISALIGEKLGLSGNRMQALIAGSFLHDVGKIGIPDAILLKPGRLDHEEMQIMRTHVSLGEEIVRGIGWLDGANEVVSGHHEKWNGEGYPRQLAGKQIPLAARIFAVADVFDALSSKRPYKDAIDFDEVMPILRKDRGTHFDPEVLDTFESIADEVHRRLSGGSESEARSLLEAIIRKHFEM